MPAASSSPDHSPGALIAATSNPASRIASSWPRSRNRRLRSTVVTWATRTGRCMRGGAAYTPAGMRPGRRNATVVHLLPLDVLRGAQLYARALVNALRAGGDRHHIVTLFASSEPEAGC